MLSPAGILLVRPFRGYAELAAQAQTQKDGPSILGGLLRFAFVVGAFIALTAAGRLAPVEHVVAMGSFAWVPVIQLVALALALRVAARDVSLRRAFALHLAGQGPSMVVLLSIAVTCLVAPAPSVAPVLFRIVPPLLVIAVAWGAVLRYACFRRALALSAARAVLATVLYTAVLITIVVAYFLAMGQLRPILS